MAQTEKRRAFRVWSMNLGGRRSLWESLKVEENWQSFWESRAGELLREGMPVLIVCLFASQGKLVGGAMPFATALLAGAMMRGRAVGFAAVGCALGALIGGSPAMLLACALMYLLFAALRMTKLRPNDLTCVAAAGMITYLMPLLFAQNAYDHVMSAAGGLTAMVLARMYASALRIRFQDRQLLSAEEIISLSLLLVGVLTGFRQLTLWEVSPVLSLLCLMCIAAGYLCGAGLGAAVGALTGLLLGVTLPAQSYLMSGMVLIGLLSGLFGRLSRGWAAAAVPVAAVLAGALDARFLTWQRVVEIAAALVFFLLVRRSVWERLRAFVDREAQVRNQAVRTKDDLRYEVCDKLSAYASLYSRMAQRLSGYGSGGQYAAVGAALRATAEDLTADVHDQPQLAHEIAQNLDRAHIRVEGVQAQKIGDQCRVCMQTACRRRDGLCDKRLLQTVSQTVGRPMRVRPHGVCPSQGLCMLTLEEAYRYETSAGFASCAPDGSQVCGDTLTTVQLPEGQYMMALADGMGHGKLAQEESRAAVGLMEDFLLARFEPEAALCAVNDLMLRRESEESFATMDLALIDLARGTLRAMKIGAVSSYIRRGRRVISITGDALPMGIMEKVRPSVTQLPMQDGDILVMLSDGVLDAVGGDEMWLQNEILAIDARSPETSARRIIARAQAVGRHQDDMTVGILRLIKRSGA